MFDIHVYVSVIICLVRKREVMLHLPKEGVTHGHSDTQAIPILHSCVSVID